MIQLTKIVHFEMAHAIDGYSGACKDIHGHSYILHVTVSSTDIINDYIPAPGFIFDFKELKSLVHSVICKSFDHKLILSRSFLNRHPSFLSEDNLVIMEFEPTAENLLLYMQEVIRKHLSGNLKLVNLKLYETNNSYAEWINDHAEY